MFLTSDVGDEYKSIHTQFVIPSISYFYRHSFPCVSHPVLQSCVDITMSTTMHYTRALNKVSIERPDLRDVLENCNCAQHQKEKNTKWQTHLVKRVKDLIDISCCERTRHPHLKYGAVSEAKVTSLLQWKCVRNMCQECGINKKLKMTECKVLNESAIVIDINSSRQGQKNGKQNT